MPNLRQWQQPGRLLARAQRLMREQALDDTLYRIGRDMRAQKGVTMNGYIRTAIAALQQMKYAAPPEEIDATIAYLRSMDNTMQLQINRIMDLQRQLMEAEEHRREA